MLNSPAPPAQRPFERSRSLPLPDRPRRLSDLLINFRRGSMDLFVGSNNNGLSPTSSSVAERTAKSVVSQQPAARRNSKSQVHAVDAEVYESLEQVLHGGSTRSKTNDELTLPAPPPLKTPSTSSAPSCFICMGRFTSKSPAIPIPCTQCKDAPVHLKCIYEWRTSTENKTCPLCRSILQEIEYTPPDPLCSSTLFMYSARMSFVNRPISRDMGMVRCYIRIVGTSSPLTRQTPLKYEMYLQAPTTRKYPGVPLPPTSLDEMPTGDCMLMTAKRTSPALKRSHLQVSLNGQYKDKRQVLASVRAGNWLGLDYTVKAPLRFHFAAAGKGGGDVELANVRFEQNRMGKGQGPRRITVCLPAVTTDSEPLDPWPPKLQSSPPVDQECEEEEDEEEEVEEEVLADVGGDEEVYKTVEHTPATKKDSLREIPAGRNGFIFARNRKPYYLESIAAFSLDFFGRVTLPSNKNFLLTCDDEATVEAASSSNLAENNMLLFGKVATRGLEGADADVYTLDFQYPLSPLQAFGIALASCDRKLGCA